MRPSGSTQAQTAELFQATPQNMTQHIKALYEEGSWWKIELVSEFLQVRSDMHGKSGANTPHFSSPTILSVGFECAASEVLAFSQLLESDSMVNNASKHPREHELRWFPG